MMIPATFLNLSLSNSSTMSVVRMSSHILLSRRPLGVRYMTMRSTIGALSANNARALSVSKVTDRLEKLSLFDDGGEASTSNEHVVSRRIPRSLSTSRTQHIHYSRSVIASQMSKISNYFNNIQAPAARLKEIMKTPMVANPHGLLDCLSTKKIFLGLGYRFKPCGQASFLMHDFQIPACLDRFKIMKESLGLSMRKNTLPIRDLCTHTRYHGIKSVLDLSYYKTMVEVVTLFNGTFGRFLILSCTGLGCTVWYSFSPCIAGQIPIELFTTPIVTYDPFFDVDYMSPTFNSVEFTTANDISEKINSAYSNVPPLSEIGIPASGVILRNVCLGVMIAFFITTGVVDISNVMDNA